MRKTSSKNRVKYQGLSTLEVLQEARNYNQWIADSILPYLSSPVLEIGAGTGNLTKHFLTKKPLYITDCDKGLTESLRNKFGEIKDVFVKSLDITKMPPKSFHSFFTTVFAINVLEHIEDDNKALKNAHRILKKNGKLVLLVPAKKMAYSKLDKELGHFRRYEKKELLEKLTSNGYHVDKIYYFNIVGLVSWYIRDKVKSNNIHLSPYHIKIFDTIVPVLRVVEGVIKMPVGISLIVVATKV